MHTQRTRHLENARGREEVQLDSGHIVTSAPGYVILIDCLRDARWQTIQLDPADLESFKQALDNASKVAGRDRRAV